MTTATATRTVAKGVGLGLGLLTCSVNMFSAVQPRPSSNVMVCTHGHDPVKVRSPKICPECGEVDQATLGRARPVDGGLVMLTDEDLAAAKAPAEETKRRPVPDFADNLPGHPFYEDIRWMAETGLAEGATVGDRVFYYPSSAVSRQAMAAFLYRYAESEWEPAPGTQTFSDVGPNHPFYTEIEWMAEEGLADGYDDGTFGSTRPVSRQAMAAFLYRSAGEPTVSGGAGFSDVSANHQFQTAIAWLDQSRIGRGYEDGTFRPVTAISRQAIAAFLHRYDDFISRAAVVTQDDTTS